MDTTRAKEIEETGGATKRAEALGRECWLRCVKQGLAHQEALAVAAYIVNSVLAQSLTPQEIPAWLAKLVNAFASVVETKDGMTVAKAEALGYQVVKVSASEVGLLKNGRGLRTWWANEFDGKMPRLGHPKILEAIVINEGTSDS